MWHDVIKKEVFIKAYIRKDKVQWKDNSLSLTIIGIVRSCAISRTGRT